MKDAIDYSVRRASRKTADIIVERDGSVHVRAPENVTDEQIAAIVDSKKLWIYKALAEWRELNASRVEREFRNGEGFLYLGRTYRLQLVDDQDEPLLLRGGRLYLRRDVAESGGADAARAAFDHYYSGRALERIAPRVAYFAPKVGVSPGGVQVRELGHRWASCSPDARLAFHWKCVMAPQTIIDYIVVHELCHLHHRDHTDAFWNEVDKVMPQYRERKEWLRVNGAGLDV